MPESSGTPGFYQRGGARWAYRRNDMPRDKLQSRHEPKMRMSGSEHFDLDQHTFAGLVVLHLADYCEGYSSNQNYRGGVRYIRHSVRGTPGFFTRGGVVGLPS